MGQKLLIVHRNKNKHDEVEQQASTQLKLGKMYNKPEVLLYNGLLEFEKVVLLFCIHMVPVLRMFCFCSFLLVILKFFLFFLVQGHFQINIENKNCISSSRMQLFSVHLFSYVLEKMKYFAILCQDMNQS